MRLFRYKKTHLLASIFFSVIFSPNHAAAQAVAPGSNDFEKRIVLKGLNDPWNIVFGPDDQLWITESKTYKVLRVNPESGSGKTLVNLSEERRFPDYSNLPEEKKEGKPWPQGGLMGMALHPELLNGKPYVYLAYIYDFEGKNRKGNGADPIDKGFHFRTRVVRYTYEKSKDTLLYPEIICDSIPGSNDHNGGRLLIAPVNGKQYLFYTVGDMGAGQFKNAARTNHAQGPNSYEGKVLRFLAEPDTTSSGAKNWIPGDNPFGTTRKNAVWSTGHRNPQGLALLPVKGIPRIYSSEHGPYSDDEINIIRKSGNYGHPHIIGYADGNYDGLAAGTTDQESLPGAWNTTYPLIKEEKVFSKKLKNYKDPILSFNATDHALLREVMESERSGEKKKKEWTSVAPSGMAAYAHAAIPSWKNSLLVTSLKQGKIIVVTLSEEGDRVTGQRDFFKAKVRYRDVAVSSDGKRIYLITDKSRVTSGPTEEDPAEIQERGAIIEYRYTSGGRERKTSENLR